VEDTAAGGGGGGGVGVGGVTVGISFFLNNFPKMCLRAGTGATMGCGSTIGVVRWNAVGELECDAEESDATDDEGGECAG
jgi:hypothetical protein